MDAARCLCLAGDFQSVSLRAIAREAGVDTSLVSYYFGSKQSLYNEAMSLPNGPHRIIAEVCSRTDPDHLGEALVRAFIDAWDGHLGLGGPDPQMQGMAQALLTQPDAFDMLCRFYTEEILALSSTTKVDLLRAGAEPPSLSGFSLCTRAPLS